MGYQDLVKAAIKEKRIKVLKPIWHEWGKSGSSVVGKLTGVVDVQSTRFDSTFKKYSMDTDDGPVQFMLGGASDNDTGIFMEVGNVYIVEFTGKEDIGKGTARNTFQITLIDAAPALNE